VGDRGHLRTMRLLPFAAAALTLKRQVRALVARRPTHCRDAWWL